MTLLKDTWLEAKINSKVDIPVANMSGITSKFPFKKGQKTWIMEDSDGKTAVVGIINGPCGVTVKMDDFVIIPDPFAESKRMEDRLRKTHPGMFNSDEL